MKRFYILPLSLLAFSVAAQQLNKEIVIERDINPELRAVSRINNYPTVILPKIDAQRLTFSDMTTSAAIPGMLTVLEPAEGADALAVSRQKGYAALGYFPALNLGASAGYRFINKPATSLGLWMQYDGNSYKGKAFNGEKYTMDRNSVTFGADFSHIFDRKGRLDINADFTHHSLNRPWQDSDRDYAANGFNVGASWTARKQDSGYFIDGRFNYFGMNNIEKSLIASPQLKKGLNQKIISLKGGGTYALTENSSLTGIVGMEFVNYNRFNKIAYFGPEDNPDWIPERESTPYVIPGNGKTMSLFTLNPSYRYNIDNFSFKLGVNLQVATNSGSTFHVAPDIEAGYKPWKYFSALLSVGGGEHINTLADLYNVNPYMSPSVAYHFSNSPIKAQLTLKGGPWKGASIGLFAGYAAVDDCLMTDIISEGAISYMPVKMRGWYAGVALDAKVGHLIKGSVKYTVAPGSYDRAYYMSPDRAKQVLEVEATAYPMDKLEVSAGFSFRGDRSIFDISGENPMRVSLKNSNSLSLGGRYAFYDWMSVFARVENILNNRAYEIWDCQRQGVKGLVGVEVKF